MNQYLELNNSPFYDVENNELSNIDIIFIIS